VIIHTKQHGYFIEHNSCPYKPRSGEPTLFFGPLHICTVNTVTGRPMPRL